MVAAGGPVRTASLRLFRPLAVGGRLADHVRQQPEKARALDGAGELALLLGRDRRDAARYDLAALGHVALQELDVLVVDLRRVGARERTGLAAAEERPASRQLRKAHDRSSVLVSPSSESSRGPRPSRSRRRSPRRSSRSRSRSALRIIADGPARS